MKTSTKILLVLLPSVFLPAIPESKAAEPIAQYVVPSSQSNVPSRSYPTRAVGIHPDRFLGFTLHFRLPEELVGANPVDNYLQLAPGAIPGFQQFNGADVSAICADGPLTTQCVISYSRAYSGSLDGTAIQNYLKQKFNSQPKVLQEKINQAASFAKDPEGVLILFH